MIRKLGDKFVVLSKKGKSMGKYATKEAAQARLQQVEWFKAKKVKGGGTDADHEFGTL